MQRLCANLNWNFQFWNYLDSIILLSAEPPVKTASRCVAMAPSVGGMWHPDKVVRADIALVEAEMQTGTPLITNAIESIMTDDSVFINISDYLHIKVWFR